MKPPLTRLDKVCFAKSRRLSICGRTPGFWICYFFRSFKRAPTPSGQGPLARVTIKRFRLRRNGTVRINDSKRATGGRSWWQGQTPSRNSAKRPEWVSAPSAPAAHASEPRHPPWRGGLRGNPNHRHAPLREAQSGVQGLSPCPQSWWRRGVRVWGGRRFVCRGRCS